MPKKKIKVSTVTRGRTPEARDEDRRDKLAETDEASEVGEDFMQFKRKEGKRGKYNPVGDWKAEHPDKPRKF